MNKKRKIMFNEVFLLFLGENVFFSVYLVTVNHYLTSLFKF